MLKDLSQTKIQVTPQQSEMVQKWAFLQGWKWNGDITGYVQYVERPHLYFLFDKIIQYGDDTLYFANDKSREITLDELLGFPQFYAVKCPADWKSNEVWKKYIAKLNEITGGESWEGEWSYYGFDGSVAFNGTNAYMEITRFSNPVTELSLEEVEIMLWWEDEKKKTTEPLSEAKTIVGAKDPMNIPDVIPHDMWLALRIDDLSTYLTYHIGCRKPINVDVVEEYNQLISK